MAVISAAGSVTLSSRSQETHLRPEDGLYTAVQAERGERIYNERCASCHGPALEGAMAPPLVGAAFVERWKGRSYRDLYYNILKTMVPGEVAAPTTLETADILAFKLKVDRFPAGRTELPGDPAVLQTIPIQVRPGT